MLADQLPTPWTDLQETPLENTELFWFVDWSHLKDETQQYQAGYIIVSLNGTTEADSMSQATSTQQAELPALT